MDPNANLDQQLELAKKIRALVESDEPLERFAHRLEELAGELAERVEALDHWITGGGFLPERWKDKRTAEQVVADWRKGKP